MTAAKKRILIYGIFGICSLLLLLPLLIWAALDVTGSEIPEFRVSVVYGEEANAEYLLGGSFDPAGYSINIGSDRSPHLVSADECELTYDFSSAGNKQVRISYKEGDRRIYYGLADVSVYFVRGITVEKQPEDITVNEDGTFGCDENFRIVAELDRMPEDLTRFAPAVGGGVYLTPDMYRTSAAESKQTAGFYTGSVYCGNLTYSFNFYQDAGRTIFVKAERNVIPFEGKNGALTLVVTDASDGYQFNGSSERDGTGSTEGWYIYTKGEEKTVIPFAYTLMETEEIFHSRLEAQKDPALPSISESREGDDYIVTCGGDTFTVSADKWQSGVVNGQIVKDGDFLFVVENEQRTLEFTRVTADPQGTATLKVYVTYYEFNMSTGSGISAGFYVYTDVTGIKYRLPFYMQTWVWDYVPLSINHQDGKYANCKVNVDYLLAQYVGDIQTQIGIDGRAETFQAPFVDIRFAAYNTH